MHIRFLNVFNFFKGNVRTNEYNHFYKTVETETPRWTFNNYKENFVLQLLKSGGGGAGGLVAKSCLTLVTHAL